MADISFGKWIIHILFRETFASAWRAAWARRGIWQKLKSVIKERRKKKYEWESDQEWPFGKRSKLRKEEGKGFVELNITVLYDCQGRELTGSPTHKPLYCYVLRRQRVTVRHLQMHTSLLTGHKSSSSHTRVAGIVCVLASWTVHLHHPWTWKGKVIFWTKRLNNAAYIV